MASKIFTTEIKVGMFVADLDRPWVDTPFLLQGLKTAVMFLHDRLLRIEHETIDSCHS